MARLAPGRIRTRRAPRNNSTHEQRATQAWVISLRRQDSLCRAEGRYATGFWLRTSPRGDRLSCRRNEITQAKPSPSPTNRNNPNDPRDLRSRWPGSGARPRVSTPNASSPADQLQLTARRQPKVQDAAPGPSPQTAQGTLISSNSTARPGRLWDDAAGGPSHRRGQGTPTNSNPTTRRRPALRQRPRKAFTPNGSRHTDQLQPNHPPPADTETTPQEGLHTERVKARRPAPSQPPAAGQGLGRRPGPSPRTGRPTPAGGRGLRWRPEAWAGQAALTNSDSDSSA